MNSPGSVTIFENQDVWTVARVTRSSGAQLLQGSIGADSVAPISYYIYDVTDGSVAATANYAYNTSTGLTADTSLAKASVVFDTLQTDGYWTGDTTGYNFRHKIDGANFPEGGRRYRIEYKIDTDLTGGVSEGPLYIITEVTTKPLLHA